MNAGIMKITILTVLGAVGGFLNSLFGGWGAENENGKRSGGQNYPEISGGSVKCWQA